MEALSPFGYLLVMIAMQFSPMLKVDGDFVQVFSNEESSIEITLTPGAYADYWDMTAIETPKNGSQTKYKASGYVKDGTLQMYSLKRTYKDKEETLFSADSSGEPMVFISEGNPWDWFYLNAEGDMIYFAGVQENQFKKGSQLIGTYTTESGLHISITMRLYENSKSYVMYAISIGVNSRQLTGTYILE